jgi:hypothetical protein
LSALFNKSRTTEVETLGSLRGRALLLLNSNGFEWLVAALIVANAVVLGFQADWSIKNIGGTAPDYFGIMEDFFVLVFTCELLLRILA